MMKHYTVEICIIKTFLLEDDDKLHKKLIEIMDKESFIKNLKSRKGRRYIKKLLKMKTVEYKRLHN